VVDSVEAVAVAVVTQDHRVPQVLDLAVEPVAEVSISDQILAPLHSPLRAEAVLITKGKIVPEAVAVVDLVVVVAVETRVPAHNLKAKVPAVSTPKFSLDLVVAEAAVAEDLAVAEAVAAADLLTVVAEAAESQVKLV
jgi:hypothetical protein